MLEKAFELFLKEWSLKVYYFNKKKLNQLTSAKLLISLIVPLFSSSYFFDWLICSL